MDWENGVNSICHRDGSCGGLAPLPDRDGKLIVTSEKVKQKPPKGTNPPAVCLCVGRINPAGKAQRAWTDKHNSSASW